MTTESPANTNDSKVTSLEERLAEARRRSLDASRAAYEAQEELARLELEAATARARVKLEAALAQGALSPELHGELVCDAAREHGATCARAKSISDVSWRAVRVAVASIVERLAEAQRERDEAREERATFRAKVAAHADAVRSYASDLAAIARAVGLGDTCEPTAVLPTVRDVVRERDEARRIAEQERERGHEALRKGMAKAHEAHMRAAVADHARATLNERLADAERRLAEVTRERDEARAAVHDITIESRAAIRDATCDAEERGARWMIESYSRAAGIGEPEDVRASIAARICAEARAKGGE